MLHDTRRKAVHSVWYMFPPLCIRVLFVLWNMVTFKISWGGGIWSPKMDLYDGAFERLFGLGRGKLEKVKCPGGCGRFDLTDTLQCGQVFLNPIEYGYHKYRKQFLYNPYHNHPASSWICTKTDKKQWNKRTQYDVMHFKLTKAKSTWANKKQQSLYN